MLSAVGPKQAFQVLEQSLSTRIHRFLLLHPAVAQALLPLHAASSAPVARMQQASGYSPRYFIAVVRFAVGLTPKHYHRIQRFNSVLRGIAAQEGGLGDVVAAAGYSDQAHLYREFREFAGVTPTQYRLAGPDRPLHHRVGDK